jgi:hypothetical protein
LKGDRKTNVSNTPNYSPHFVDKWGEVQRRVIFCILGRVIFVLSKLNVCGEVISIPRPTLSRNGHGVKDVGDVQMKDSEKTRS